MSDLAGKVALITGSSRGVGRATALLLGSRGARVVVNYRRHEMQAQKVLERIRELGSEGLAIAADLEDPGQIDDMFDAIGERFGKLDIFVANAAATAFKDLLEVRPHHLHRTFAITLNAFIQGVQRAVPLMKDGGRIVALSGLDSRRFLARHAVLGAAKAALETLVSYWACELAGTGITVNGVLPGLIDSDSGVFYARAVGLSWEELATRYRARTPQGRILTPEDVAGVIAFLCSRAAEMINGQTLVVDGGLMLMNPV